MPKINHIIHMMYFVDFSSFSFFFFFREILKKYDENRKIKKNREKFLVTRSMA